MTNVEAIVLAQLVIEGRQKWEMIALGAYFHGLNPRLSAEMLSGVRKLCWQLWQGDADPINWAEAPKECGRKALRMFNHQSDRAPDAMFMLALVEHAEMVLAALFDLEKRAHALDEHRQALLDARLGPLLARSATPENESSPRASGTAGNVTAMPRAVGYEAAEQRYSDRGRSAFPVRKTDSDRPTSFIQGATALKRTP